MRAFFKWTGIVFGALVLAIGLFVAAWWFSPDFRYQAVYVLMEHFDLNPPVSAAALKSQSQALRRIGLVDSNGRPFDWNADPHAVIWINEWANWCVPCRMEFPAMQALEKRVGRDKLRIVLLSQPKYWNADKRLAKTLGPDFEYVTPGNASPSDLAAMNLSKAANGFLLPEHTFLRADGNGIEAFQSVKDWDSDAWQAIILHWYADGLEKSGAHGGHAN